MIAVLGVAATAYLLALFLNHRVVWLNRLLLPPSLLAGLLLLILGPQIAGTLGSVSLPHSLYDSYYKWPGLLISFLFSGMILEPVSQRKTHSSAVLSQAVYVWFIAFSQLALGYAVVAVLGLNSGERLFAHAIELSFLGGHGASSAFYDIAENLGFRPAADLSVAAATIGILWGLGAGLGLTIFHRRYPDYGRRVDLPEPAPDEDVDLVTDESDEDRMFLSFLLPMLPVFLAYLILSLIGELIPKTGEIPLFFVVILVAHAMKKVLRPFLFAPAVRTFHRFTLEALILAAVATLSLQVIGEYATVLFTLCAGAALLTVLVHLFVAPRFLPSYPDLALINFGMSTGTTAIGLATLRLLRNPLPVLPVQIYGLAAPLSGPFIGGGMLSLFLFPELTLQFSPFVLFAVMAGLSIVCLIILRLLRHAHRG